MAVRKIIRMGHPTLRRKAEPIANEMIGSASLSSLITDMKDTLRDYGGIGLAAPQIDELIQLAIIDLPGGQSRYGELEALPLTVCINPVVTTLDTATTGYWEGCLSVPGLRGFVERPQRIRMAYTDTDGARLEREFSDFHATVVQHEIDHLRGILYVDHILDPSLLVFEDEYLRYVVPSEEQTG
ncbi:MAG: peptide deformylase [Pseudomonadales bacterium]